MNEQPVFVDPWWDLRGGGPTEHRQREAMAKELREEVAAGHPLHRQSFQVIARSDAADDIAIELATGGWALVHLTWQRPDRPPWPSTTIYDTSSALEEALRWRYSPSSGRPPVSILGRLGRVLERDLTDEHG